MGGERIDGVSWEECQGMSEKFTSGCSSILNSASSPFDRFKSAVTVFVSRKPGMAKYLGVLVYHTTFVHDQGVYSPISMELLQKTKQGFSRVKAPPAPLRTLSICSCVRYSRSVLGIMIAAKDPIECLSERIWISCATRVGSHGDLGY